MNKKNAHAHADGFTLMELMVTLAILSVLLAIAIPTFSAIIRNNTIATVNNELIGALNLARSEAIKRNSIVSVCATQDQNFSSCGSNWNQGWLVFVNPTGGSTLTNTTSAPLLRIHKINDTFMTVTPSPSVNIVHYNGSGFPGTATANVAFTIKATDCTIDYGRKITISITGRPVVTTVTCP